MAFHVSTEQYEFSHLKKPRGRGYWAFIMSAPGVTYRKETWFTRGDRLYSDAKQEAITHALANGWSKIEVAP